MFLLSLFNKSCGRLMRQLGCMLHPFRQRAVQQGRKDAAQTLPLVRKQSKQVLHACLQNGQAAPRRAPKRATTGAPGWPRVHAPPEGSSGVHSAIAGALPSFRACDPSTPLRAFGNTRVQRPAAHSI